MVKFEAEGNWAVYINPARIESLEASNNDGFTRVCMIGGAVHVKGTPDEVHAKLFPEASSTSAIKDETAAIAVLEWALDDFSDFADWRESARKALGR